MNDYNVVLEHSGTKGMHWGVRNAEWYPISAWKAHLRREGKNNPKEGIVDKIKKRKAAKEKAVRLEKAREARAKALASKKEKDEIIRTGDINKASERINDFTNEEIRLITERNQAKISLTKAKTDAVLSKMGTMAEASNRIANIVNNSVSIYNNFAKISNTFGGTELPIIKDNVNQQNNQSKNQNNEDKKVDNSKKIEKEIDKRIKDIEKAAKKNAEKAAKEAKKKEETERVSGTVEGNANKEKYEKAAKAVDDVIVDAVWKDITDSDIRKGEEEFQKRLKQVNYPLIEMKKK